MEHWTISLVAYLLAYCLGATVFIAPLCCGDVVKTTPGVATSKAEVENLGDHVQVAGIQLHPSDSPKTTPPGENSVKEAAYDVQDKSNTTITTTVPVIPEGSVDKGALILRDASGHVCIRLALRASFSVRYVANQRSRVTLREAVIPMPGPEDLRTNGTCGTTSSSILISWVKGNHSLQIDFKEKTKEKDGEDTDGWGATTIILNINTADRAHFQDAYKPGVHVTSSSNSIEYFWTPRNHSYACMTNQKVVLSERVNGSEVQSVFHSLHADIWDVKAQAFDIPQSNQFSQAAVCQADSLGQVPPRNLVPVIVAGCLAALIVIIIIAYVISKNMSGGAYRPMD